MKLFLVSLGVEPPATATLQGLNALASCSRIFAPQGVGADCLAALGKKSQPLRSTEEVLSALKAGSTVGVITTGGLPGSDPAAAALRKACQQEKIEVETVCGVSAAERWLADTGQVLGHDVLGLQFLSPGAAARGVSLDHRLAHVVEAGGMAPAVSLRGKRVFLTGATGFIGSRLALRLQSAGARLHLFVRDPGRVSPALASSDAVLHAGDLRDAASLQRAVKAARPEYAFSLAAVREPGLSPEKEALLDLDATEALGAALRGAKGLRRWVRTALRAGPGFPQAQEDSLQKRLSASGLPVLTLRLFRVFGPEPKLPAGQKGACDWIHVDDVVEAYLLAASAAAGDGRSLDVGSGRLRGGNSGGHPAEIGTTASLLGWKPARTREILG